MLVAFLLFAGLAAAFPQTGDTDTNRGNCSSLELIIARGTNEPLNVTYGLIVGDPLFVATKVLIPDVTGYAVNYPADLSCPSRFIGANDTVRHLNAQAALCPKQMFSLVGYSQGAEVMHYAAIGIQPKLYDRIVAVVEFGDPGHRGPKAISPFGGVVPPFPPDLAYKLRENCADGDPVCTNDGTIIAAHLSYSSPGTTFIEDSADYIKRQLDSGGEEGPEPSNNVGPDEPTPENKAALCALGAALGGVGTTTCSTFPPCPPTATPIATTTTLVAALVTPAAKLRI